MRLKLDHKLPRFLLAGVLLIWTSTAWAQDHSAPLAGQAVPRVVLDCTRSSATEGQVSGTSRLLATLAGDVVWQPRDGTLRFTITAPENVTPTSLDNIEVAVCFGWPQLVFATADTDRTPKLYAATSLRTVARTDNSITYETTLPDRLWSHENNGFAPSFWDVLWDFVRFWRGRPVHVYDGWGIVPIVHMHIVARSLTETSTLDPNALDTILPVGISFRLVALGMTLFAVFVAWRVLSVWASYRKIPGDAILRIVANQNGYASLSQFQILLWTVVIGAGITYVMMLSGSLIDVPNQVLALLGISGFSALSAAYAARPKNAQQQQSVNPAQQQPAPAANAPHRTPRWSDLVVWDGTGEVDITRVQMLVFTALAAAFVAIKIGDEGAIPMVPDGIVLLMGLTNGVYVGGKFVSDRR